MKALMITFSHVELNSPYPYSPYLRKVPSYYGLVFDNALNAGANAKDFYHYSRYWIGDVNKLKTRINVCKQNNRGTDLSRFFFCYL